MRRVTSTVCGCARPVQVRRDAGFVVPQVQRLSAGGRSLADRSMSLARSRGGPVLCYRGHTRTRRVLYPHSGRSLSLSLSLSLIHPAVFILYPSLSCVHCFHPYSPSLSLHFFFFFRALLLMFRT